MKTFIMMVFLLGPTITQAQVPSNPWYGADTAQSAGFKGLGQRLRGEASRIQALGDFHTKRQQAYNQYLDNTNKKIRYRWALKDDAKARRNAQPNVLDRMESRMNMAERRYALKQREDDLIKRGILPPRKVSNGFYYKGERYNSYAQFKLSPAHDQMIAEREIRFAKARAVKAAEQARYDAAVRFLAKRRRMDPINRVFMDQRNARNRTVRRVMGEAWWNKYMK